MLFLFGLFVLFVIVGCILDASDYDGGGPYDTY